MSNLVVFPACNFGWAPGPWKTTRWLHLRPKADGVSPDTGIGSKASRGRNLQKLWCELKREKRQKREREEEEEEEEEKEEEEEEEKATP